MKWSGILRLPRQLGMIAISGYQRLISPFMAPRCRFHPSCSEYAKEALEKKGLIWGAALTLWRLLRCQPLSDGGYDPVR